MIVTGVVKEINVSNSNTSYEANLYKVDIGVFKTTANLNSTKSILECTASSSGGLNQEYDVGDAVYVDFVNDKTNYPVIIGHIYKGLDNTKSGSRAYANFRSLSVTDNATLPVNTIVGETNLSDLIAKVYNNQTKVVSGGGGTITGDGVLDVRINGQSVVNNTTKVANLPTANGSTYGVIQGTTITNITDKIPSEATSSNKLADKAFVNSSIATATANFLGTLDVVTDLGLSYGATTDQIVVKLNLRSFLTKTNNDYCFVINKDAYANVLYQRFKWVASNSTFKYEYALNNSSFTSVQWAAINSGITSSLVTDLNSNTLARHTHSNMVLLNSIVAAEQTRKIIVSTNAPSALDGNEGDIWIKYIDE